MVNFLWDRGRPRPPVAQKASGRKLFVLRTGAGKGARGPSKSGYQRPNLEFQTDPLPFPVPLLLSSLFSVSNQSDWVFLRGKCFHLGGRTHQTGSQDE
jgi:hypothetical protein